MSQSDLSRTEAGPACGALYGTYVVALAVSMLGNLFIRMGAESGVLPAWGQAVVGAAASVPLLIAAVMFWRLLRRDLDEMLQRIVLEGLAFALILYIPLTALYVNLRTAGVWLPRLDPPDMLMAPALLVAIGIAVAHRRYQ
ncbi:MAG TPA: hypothetical protein VMZ90_07215 [Vicinamibacterales bacterium]|nr:hypothetical protein [Vicinamibacterales bacterium]